ncbi:MAG: glycosyltransferase [Flavobacteriales bacterium]|nr:glycosyltransferase [Flavobacteriales bacterium]
MPRVLRIVNRFNIGGPTYNAAYLTKHLSPDYKTLLIGGEIEKNESSSIYILRDLGVKPIIIPEMQRSMQYNGDLVAYYKLKEIIKRFKPDIVHTHASKSGALGRWAAYKCGVPVVLHTFHGHVFHSYFNRLKTELVKQTERRMANISTRIIALSEMQKYELSEIHHICYPDKISVIPLGFDLSRFRENTEEKRARFRKEYSLTNNDIAIGIIGRLSPIKNHDLFISAIRHSRQNTTRSIRAFIIGDGERHDELVRKCLEEGLTVSTKADNNTADVIFTSWIKDVDIAIAGLDLVCLTSLNEGTPVSLIEAQASSRCVLSMQVGGIENVVKNHYTGMLTSSSEQFQAVMVQLITDSVLRSRLALNGWEHVRENFHYTRLVNDTKRLYDELLEKKKEYHVQYQT